MQWIVGGGPVMYPLLICSVVALAVIIERALSLSKKQVIRPELVRLIQDIRDVGDVPMAFSKCQVIKGPFSNIIKHTLVNMHLSWEEKLHEIQVAGKEEAKRLERNLNILEIIASIAPLLGLFGTVLGLDEIFGVMATVGLGDPKSFSGGIAQALRTTILGLAIAMPTSIAAGVFDRKVDSMVSDMERLSTVLLNKLYASKVRMERGGRLEEFKMRGPGEKV
ncbi:MAG TPA: MotA/TolQ/ExbB proton channel family protein [Candidatus Tripitaka californicus]|uniref:MotA/TolQ/ExbB proton channel family protein n=1 Tax=Candidatus Tripitaka californicus TaxID=3367616 RepID=UPI004024D214|nr:MotA/TolQ/ExbB proton channel family protein [Planctomycetota bacterium]